MSDPTVLARDCAGTVAMEVVIRGRAYPVVFVVRRNRMVDVWFRDTVAGTVAGDDFAALLTGAQSRLRCPGVSFTAGRNGMVAITLRGHGGWPGCEGWWLSPAALTQLRRLVLRDAGPS